MAFGLPALSRAVNTVGLLAADALFVIHQFGPPRWGLFKDSKLAIEPDSIFEMEMRADWRVADYPQEQGAFQSYNKVTEPKSIKVTMTKGSAQSGIAGAVGGLVSGALGLGKMNATRFLDTLQTAAASLDVFDVYTPQAIYRSMTIEHFDYRRRAEGGVSLLTVDVWMREVRATATATYTNAQQPSGADPQSTGTVQAQPPDATSSTSTTTASTETLPTPPIPPEPVVLGSVS